MTEYRPYEITVRLSGSTENFEGNIDENGIITFNPSGNKKTSEKSALAYVKTTARLCGCKIEEIIEIKKVM